MNKKVCSPLGRTVKTISIRKRRHKVSLSMFARLCKRGGTFRQFYQSLPKILAAEEFRACVDAVVTAYKKRKPVIVAMGGHVVKCGLSGIIIDLMNRGVVTAVAMNGATSIHDFEVALIGKTSEDVERGLKKGTFGMVSETGVMINEALEIGVARGMGAGWAIGRYILEKRLAHREMSILAQAVKLRLPATVHIAIGTDTIHQHPQADGAVIGKATMDDFRMFTEVVTCIGGGGIFLNLGSAVVLPEVFLKALTVARNVGKNVKDFTTASFDMFRQYRVEQNVAKRPVAEGGRGYYFVGHHEIMIPLFVRAIIEQL